MGEGCGCVNILVGGDGNRLDGIPLDFYFYVVVSSSRLGLIVAGVKDHAVHWDALLGRLGLRGVGAFVETFAVRKRPPPKSRVVFLAFSSALVCVCGKVMLSL